MASEPLAHCSSCTCFRHHSHSYNINTIVDALLRSSSGVAGGVGEGEDQGGARSRRAGGGSGGGAVAQNGEVRINVGEATNWGSGSIGGHGAGHDAGEAVVAEIVARNLLELSRPEHKFLKGAFDDWESTFKLFQKRREYKEAQRDNIRNEIYQLIGFFIVFQGVVFTAVAQANVLHCRNWWTAVILSGLASIVTIGGVVQKLFGYWALETTIASEKASSTVLRKRIDTVKSQGPSNFNFRIHARDGSRRGLKKPGIYVVTYMIVVISVLLAFSSVFLAASVRILCEP